MLRFIAILALSAACSCSKPTQEEIATKEAEVIRLAYDSGITLKWLGELDRPEEYDGEGFTHELKLEILAIHEQKKAQLKSAASQLSQMKIDRDRR